MENTTIKFRFNKPLLNATLLALSMVCTSAAGALMAELIKQRVYKNN